MWCSRRKISLWKSFDWSAFAGKLKPLYCGGAERFESVRNGLDAIRDEVGFEDWVLVHDAARPGLSGELLDRLIGEVGEDPFGGLLAVPVADTLKRADADNRVLRTESRDKLWQAQTPQMFRYSLLQRALSLLDGAAVTDEAQAVERMGFQAKLVAGDMTNFKVTYPQDIKLAELILRRQGMRVGQGFDVHQLVEGRKLIIGGVDIPYERGLLGHSDADVLLHAICDALLGAAALGDIGRHFPDSDPRYKGIDSRRLLREVMQLLKDKGYGVVNLDATIIAQAPKMAPHIEQMVANIAADLGVEADCVNVKATTTEKLGFTGRGEGIAAQAVCLIEKRLSQKLVALERQHAGASGNFAHHHLVPGQLVQLQPFEIILERNQFVALRFPAGEQFIEHTGQLHALQLGVQGIDVAGGRWIFGQAEQCWATLSGVMSPTPISSSRVGRVVGSCGQATISAFHIGMKGWVPRVSEQ